MKNKTWYACLGYGKIELIIPQTEIADSNFAPGEDPDDFSLSDFMRKTFGIKDFFGALTKLTLAGEPKKSVCTHRVPRLEEIPDDEFLVLGGKIGNCLRRKGLLSCRFYEDKIQYLVDLRRLEESWNKIL